jgi:hypothetical protein
VKDTTGVVQTHPVPSRRPISRRPAHLVDGVQHLRLSIALLELAAFPLEVILHCVIGYDIEPLLVREVPARPKRLALNRDESPCPCPAHLLISDFAASVILLAASRCSTAAKTQEPRTAASAQRSVHSALLKATHRTECQPTLGELTALWTADIAAMTGAVTGRHSLAHPERSQGSSGHGYY